MLPVGLHQDVPPEVYYRRELGLVSKSALDYVLDAPAKYKAWIDGLLGDDDTAALRVGRAFHVAVLEPGRFELEYAIQPDFGNCSLKGPKAMRATWRELHEEQVWLSPDDGAMVLGMARSVRAHPKVAKILARGFAESTLRWDDAGVGLPCKARTDWLAPELRLLVDLKSTTDASEWAFGRDVESYGYHRQAASYRDGLEELRHPVDHVVFIVTEKSPPYLTALYSIDPKDEQAGRDQTAELKSTLLGCLTHDRWPGLSEDVVEVRRPRWAR